MLIIVENCPVPRDRRVWKQCGSLLDAGLEVSVIAPRAPGQRAHEVVDGVRVHRYRPARERAGRAGFVLEFANAWVRTAALSARIFVREGFALVQACNPPDIFFPLGLLYRAAGCPFVFDQHDLSPELYTARYGRSTGFALRALLALERRTYRAADHVIAVSEPWAQVAIDRGAVPAESVTIVGNGPPMTGARPRPARPELRSGREHLCCWVGAMGAVDDGVDLAVRAVSHLVHDLGRADCHFAFLGDGEDFRRVTALARDLGVSDWITFPGWTEPDLVQDYLATADLGLQPDPKNPRTDTAIAVKTLEYMASGLPVVAFDLDETRRVVGPAGAYASGNDPVGFAREIDALLDDPARRAAMGAEGRRRIEGALCWELQGERYVAVIRGLLASGPRRRGVSAGGEAPGR